MERELTDLAHQQSVSMLVSKQPKSHKLEQSSYYEFLSNPTKKLEPISFLMTTNNVKENNTRTLKLATNHQTH